MKKILMLLTLAGSLAMADSNVPFDENTDSLSPVPEPATIGMLGIGVGAIAFGAWRKSRKR